MNDLQKIFNSIQNIETLLTQKNEPKIQEQLPLINEFRLYASDVDKIDFSKVSVSHESLKNNWKIIPLNKSTSDEILSVVTGLLGVGSQAGLAQGMTNGLFRATASPDTLMKLSQGGLSSAVIENGRIINQAGFVHVGSSFVTPLIVFQVISMVTGQYYMDIVNKQLNEIQDKLNKIEKRIHAERIAKLKKSTQLLNQLSNQTAYEIEDFVLLKHIMSELLDIREEYAWLLEDYVNTELHELDKDVSFWSKSKTNFKKVIDKFMNSGFIENLEISIKADELYHTSRILEYQMNLSFKEPSLDRIHKIKELKQSIQNFDKSDFMLVKTNKLYKLTKQKFSSELLAIANQTWLDKEEVSLKWSQVGKIFQEYEQEKEHRFNLLKNQFSEVLKPMYLDKEILLDLRNERPCLYAKK